MKVKAKDILVGDRFTIARKNVLVRDIALYDAFNWGCITFSVDTNARYMCGTFRCALNEEFDILDRRP